MEDLVLLDSIIRTPNDMTDELGGLQVPVSCNVEVDRSMNLTGLRLGLPSNFGWVNPGLSGEVPLTVSSQNLMAAWSTLSLGNCEMIATVVSIISLSSLLRSLQHYYA